MPGARPSAVGYDWPGDQYCGGAAAGRYAIGTAVAAASRQAIGSAVASTCRLQQTVERQTLDLIAGSDVGLIMPQHNDAVCL